MLVVNLLLVTVSATAAALLAGAGVHAATPAAATGGTLAILQAQLPRACQGRCSFALLMPTAPNAYYVSPDDNGTANGASNGAGSSSKPSLSTRDDSRAVLVHGANVLYLMLGGTAMEVDCDDNPMSAADAAGTDDEEARRQAGSCVPLARFLELQIADKAPPAAHRGISILEIQVKHHQQQPLSSGAAQQSQQQEDVVQATNQQPAAESGSAAAAAAANQQWHNVMEAESDATARPQQSCPPLSPPPAAETATAQVHCWRHSLAKWVLRTLFSACTAAALVFFW